MGISKSAYFSLDDNEIANLAKALSHPARVAILNHLVKVGTCICGDIVNELPLAQPTVSQHLKELKAAGWISGAIEGKSICYCIDTQALKKFQSFFGGISAHLNSKQATCC